MLRHLLFSLLLLGTLSLAAQEAPSLSTTSDEVIVTGARYARPQSESPEHVTVIDSTEITRAPNLSQLLNEQAGIVVNGAYSNYGKDRSVFLRNGANQYTLILIDGQPLIDPSSLGGAVDLRLLSLDGIERIEILRGASSLLYGSDAVAGVINLITKQETDGGPHVSLRAAAERYGTFEGRAGLSGGSAKLGYRLGADYFRTDGISEAVPPAGSAAEYNRDGADRQTYTGSLTYRPTEELTLRPSLRRAVFTGDYDAGAFQDGDNSYTNDLWLPGLSVDYEKNDVHVGGRYTFAATDRTFDDGQYGESVYRGRAQQGDAYVNLRPSEALAVTLGGQLRHERLADGDDDTEDLTATSLSPYVQANLNVAEKLLVESGVRYTHHSNFGGQVNASGAVGFRHTPVLSTRLSVASAYQSPTLDQLGGPFGANPDLQPQVSTSWGGGAQVQCPDNGFGATLTVFQRNIRDLVTYDYALGYQNQDELRDRGVELEAGGPLGSRLRLSGNATYVKGRLSTTDDAGEPTEQTEFYRRPRLTGHLGLTYQADSPFTARLSATYTGERPDVYFDENFAAVPTALDPFLIVNAYAEYRFLPARTLTVFGEVRNLTDTRFTEVTGYGTLGVTPRIGVAWNY